jgi:hypothetical protein
MPSAGFAFAAWIDRTLAEIAAARSGWDIESLTPLETSAVTSFKS